MLESRMVLSFVLLSACLMLAGCGGSVSIPDTPDGTVLAVADQMADHNPSILWEAMPPSYQKDVNSLIAAFAGKMDAEIYDKGAGILSKALNILKTKRDYILANPMIAEGGPFSMMVKSQELKNQYDSVVDLVGTVVNSELKTLASVKSMDVGSFLEGTGGKLMKQISELSSISTGDEFNKEVMSNFKDVKVEVVSQEGDTATLKITASGKTETTPMVKVEGKWLPKDLVDGWAQGVAEMKSQIAVIAETEMTQKKPEIMIQFAAVEGLLDQLAKAESAEQFNQIVMGLLQGM